MRWDEFVAIPNGTRVLNHGWDQCVALANLYHEQVIGGSFVPVGSAFQWSTDFWKYRTLVQNYVQVGPAGDPIAGDIFVSRGGIYNWRDGHIGVVVRDWDGATFGTKEQNAERNRYTWQTYNRTKANMLSYLRPKISPIPKPVIDETEEQMYSIAVIKNGPAFLWNMFTGEYKWIDVVPEWEMFQKNLKKYEFNTEADFKAFRDKYPFTVKTSGVSPSLDVQAVAKAVNDDAARRMQQ